VYDTIGKVIPPGGLPLAVGAVVINAETALNVFLASQGEAVTEKFLTVAGAVREPSTFRVPLGVTFAALVEAAGGATASDPVVMVGGVMMGQLETNLDTPVIKTTGGLVVLPREHPVIQRRMQTEKQLRQIGRSACDQCSFCTELCPRYLLGHPVEPHKAMRSLGFALSQPEPPPGTQFCCECNLCSLYACPESLDPRNVCGLGKRTILADGKKWANAPLDELRVRNVFPFRRAPIAMLIRRVGLQSYKNAGPLRPEKTFAPDKVVLPLKQHAGTPAEPTVRPGDRVTKGQVVGKVPQDKLGANVHSSVAGTVERADEQAVVIKCE